MALVRITPTYMGNTSHRCTNIALTKDHPHIHGEYCLLLPPTHLLAGITPTYMGNTTGAWFGGRHDWDHPHIHGEYQLIAVRKKDLLGSPPHTWGILFERRSDPVSSRITPTYMGNTVNRSLYDAFFRSLVCHF